MLRKKTTDLERRLEWLNTHLHIVTAIAARNAVALESNAETNEILAAENDELKAENRELMVEAELRDQQLASLMDMVAERNQYTEHLGAMDVSKVTDPVALLEMLVREARDLSHEYSTTVRVVKEELEYSGL